MLSYSQAEPGRELTQPSPRLLAEPCSLKRIWKISDQYIIKFKIELWDEDYNFVRSLSSDTESEEEAEWIADDTTAQSQMVG